MKDDLLIRFIDGRTTPEETELVIRELSQDGEAAKEWMQMVQGARLADKRPLREINSDEFIAKTLAQNTSGTVKTGKVLRLPRIIGGIAAVAASVAIIVTVVMKSSDPEVPQNIMADVADTTEVVPQTDMIKDEIVPDIKEAARESIADVRTPDVKEQVSGAEEYQMPEELEQAGEVLHRETNTATVFEMETPSLEMVKPAKTPYRVKVKDPSKEFVFEWKMSAASMVRFSIADSSGAVIVDNQWVSETSFGVEASRIADKGELDWTVEVTFADGSMQRKTGKIELVSIVSQ